METANIFLARSLLKALEEEERSDLLDLIELSDMVSSLEEAQNLTFFVPSREAFEVRQKIDSTT